MSKAAGLDTAAGELLAPPADCTHFSKAVHGHHRHVHPGYNGCVQCAVWHVVAPLDVALCREAGCVELQRCLWLHSPQGSAETVFSNTTQNSLYASL